MDKNVHCVYRTQDQSYRRCPNMIKPQKFIITKLHNTNPSDEFLIRYFCFLFSSTRVTCHCVRIHISTKHLSPCVFIADLKRLVNNPIPTESQKVFSDVGRNTNCSQTNTPGPPWVTSHGNDRSLVMCVDDPVH
jgi:hypothetical protein